MTDKTTGPTESDLLEILLERNVLSRAQVEVAKIDIAATGLSPADVLLARKWISEDDLATFDHKQTNEDSKNKTTASPPASLPGSPKAGTLGGERVSNSSSSSEQIYLDNLRKYRQLMAKILGEAD